MKYDASIQMFVEEPRPVDRDHLLFLRWLGERGLLEHPVAGPAAGELVPLHDDTIVSQAS